MSDFFQTGAIATLHRLGPTDVPRLERDLREFAKETPIALVLPCHIREVGTRALRGIARELARVSYLKQIIVGIDGARGVRPGPVRGAGVWRTGITPARFIQAMPFGVFAHPAGQRPGQTHSNSW